MPMKNILNKFLRNERGQALIITLGFLVVGGLVIVTTLAHMYTGLRSTQIDKERMNEYYAADAAVEDALHKIISSYEPLQTLEVNSSYIYNLGDPVNGITPISTSVTKRSLLDDILDPSEYKTDRPHEGWISFGSPLETENTEDYVEYSCNITLENTGSGSRTIQILGVFFAPLPGDASLILGPSDIVYAGNMTDSMLEADSPELKLSPGGFAFLWRWEPSKGPTFKVGDTGSLSFTFQVYDPEWEHDTFFAFATTKEEDISFITSNPVPYKWLIEATAARTKINSCVVKYIEGLDILTWKVR
jgi:hypothetical protein